MDGLRATAATSACVQALVLDDVGGGLAALHGVVVGDQHGAEGVLQARVGDVDRRHRLGVLGDLRPHAQYGEHPLGAGREREGARVARAGGGVKSCAVGNGDAHAVAQRICERARQGQAGRAAAGDDHVVALRGTHPLANRSVMVSDPEGLTPP